MKIESRRRDRSRVAALSLVLLFGSALPAACAFDEHGSIDLMGRACIPGRQSACYTGPAGTLGKGECKGGVNVCRIDGTFGACNGEVLPQPEDCDTPLDEDCDGEGRLDSECLCNPNETKPCETGLEGVCAGGARYCADDGGSFGACIQLAEPSLEDCVAPLDEDCDGFVIACTGAPDTSTAAGSAFSDMAFAVATNGLVYAAAGVSSSDVSFRDVNTGKLYVDRRDSKLDVSWTLEIPSSLGRAVARGVAVTSKGAILATGDFNGVMNVGPSTVLMSAASSADIFVLALGTTGDLLWAKSFGDLYPQAANALALGPNGAILIAGEAQGSPDFGSGVPLVTAGGGDAFVVELDAAGKHVWSRAFGDAMAQRAYGLATTPDGDALVAGEFDGSIDFGGSIALASAGIDAFVAKLSRKDGSAIWALKLGDDFYAQRAYAVAAGPSGEVAVTGAFGGIMTIGGQTLASKSQTDAFVMVLEPDGALRWIKALGDAAGIDQVGGGVAFDPLGHVLVTGSFDGSIDFGAGAVTATGLADAFVAKFEGPTGKLVWEKHGGDGSAQRGWGIASLPNARVVAAGGFSGMLHFGDPPMPLTSMGASDIFVTRFAP